jgi:hypothetical protein
MPIQVELYIQREGQNFPRINKDLIFDAEAYLKARYCIEQILLKRCRSKPIPTVGFGGSHSKTESKTRLYIWCNLKRQFYRKATSKAYSGSTTTNGSGKPLKKAFYHFQI